MANIYAIIDTYDGTKNIHTIASVDMSTSPLTFSEVGIISGFETKYIFINDVNIKSCLETVNKNICDKIMDGIQFDSEEYIHLTSLYSGMYVTSGKNDLENTKKIFDALTANCQNCLDCLC